MVNAGAAGAQVDAFARDVIRNVVCCGRVLLDLLALHQSRCTGTNARGQLLGVTIPVWNLRGIVAVSWQLAGTDKGRSVLLLKSYCDGKRLDTLTVAAALVAVATSISNECSRPNADYLRVPTVPDQQDFRAQEMP